MSVVFLGKTEEKLKLCLKFVWISFAKVIVVAVLSCFFLVPGFWALCSFAFTELISLKCPALDTKGVFMLSKELTSGHKKEILVQFFSAFGNAVFVGVLMLALFLIIDCFLAVSEKFYFVFIPLILFLSAFVIMEISLCNVFEQIMQEKMAMRQ